MGRPPQAGQGQQLRGRAREGTCEPRGGLSGAGPEIQPCRRSLALGPQPDTAPDLHDYPALNVITLT